MTVAFEVRGQPVTQGSKRAFVNKHTGRAIVTESGGQSHKDWRSRVAGAAQDAMAGEPLIAGPVLVRLVFTLPKPASAPKRKRTWPIAARSGDVDKLARSILDSLTAVVFRDDAQVVHLTVTKDFGDPGVWCFVAELFGSAGVVPVSSASS